MFAKLKIGLLSFSLGASALLAGCQSGGEPMAASHEMASDAVACDKCQVTWVKYPISSAGGQGGRGYSGVTGYGTRKQMVCEDCKDAVSNFFATGNLKHDCKACGGNMAVCDKH